MRNSLEYRWLLSQKVTGGYEPVTFMESWIAEGLVTQIGDEVHRFEYDHLHPCCPFRAYQEGEVMLTSEMRKQEKKQKEAKEGMKEGRRQETRVRKRFYWSDH